MSGGAAVLERIGAEINSSEFDRLVVAAMEQMFPARPLRDPRRDLSTPEIAVLQQGGFDLKPQPLDSAHPLIRSAAAYSALLASSLSVSQAAARLHVEDSRIRQRLGERTLYGIKLKAVWRLPRFQFTDEGMVPGLGMVLPHLDPALHPLSVLGWFTTPNPDLVYGEDEEPVTPLDWLHAGYPVEPVSELAANLPELG